MVGGSGGLFFLFLALRWLGSGAVGCFLFVFFFFGGGEGCCFLLFVVVFFSERVFLRVRFCSDLQ